MKNQTMKISRRSSKTVEKTWQRLVKAPEIACRIFEFAESLYLRDETSERMSCADIAQIHAFLRETENDFKRVKRQFQDLVEIEDDFSAENIPVGF